MVNWRTQGGMMRNKGELGLVFIVANMVRRNYAMARSVRAFAL
jgi:hypothetical protein